MAGKSFATQQSTAQKLDSDIAEIIRQSMLEGAAAEQQGVAPIQEAGVTIAPTSSTTTLGYTSESVPASTPMQQSIEQMAGVQEGQQWFDPAQSELRQQGAEAPQSFQQLLDMDLENEQRRMTSADLHKAFGELGGQEYIDGLVRLRDYDIANTARKELTEEYTESLRALREAQDETLSEVLATPQEGEATLDADGKFALSQQALLLSKAGMDAGIPSADKGMRVDPDFIMSTFMSVEPLLAMSDNSDLVSQEMREALSREDIDDLGLKGVIDEEQVKSLEQLGKLMQANWEMAKQVRAQGLDTVANPKAGPKLSSEAYSQLGLIGQAMYAEAFPGVLQRVSAKDGGDFFSVTPAGQAILAEKAKRVSPPKFHAPPVTGSTDFKGQHKYTAETRATTGKQIRPDNKNESENKITEATRYYSRLRHMADPMRANMAMAFGTIAMKQASKVFFNQDNTHLDYIADFFGVGQERIDKIKNAHVVASDKLYEINKKIKNARGDRLDFLRRKADALQSFIKEAQTPRWQEGMYKLFATRQLEMLNDIATYKYDNVSFTFARQLANTRLTIQQTRMNPQAHKVARNVFGSTTIYQIQPGSNSDAEFAMLVSFGATLFNQANMDYEKSYERMKKRIKTTDPALDHVYAAGKELAEIFGSYDPTSTMESLGALTVTEAGIDGVQSVLQDGGVASVEAALDGASDNLKSFMRSAGNHPDEFVSILEHAVEFAKYMDSYKAGKPFTSAMRPIEVDGISNGLAALLAMLGEYAPMFRVGVLREDPNRILSGGWSVVRGGATPTSELGEYTGGRGETYEFVEGDLRDLFKHNMLTNVGYYLNDNSFRREFNIRDDELEVVTQALQMAVSDKKNFLKPPMMTLPYGQAIASMKGQAYKTIMDNKELQIISNEMGQERLAGILHAIMGNELTNTLGPNVIKYISSLQEMMGRTTLLGQPLVYKQAVGTMTSVSDTAFRQKKLVKNIRTTMRPKTTEGQYLTPKEGGPQAIHEGSQAFAGDISVATEVFQTAAMAKGGIPGGSVRSAAAPQVVIGLDGATIVNLVTGQSLKAIRNKMKGKNPYVLPIFDAILTDLGSFRSVTGQINKVWFDLVMEYDLIGEMIKGFERANKQGLAKWAKKEKANPKGLVKDREHAAYVYTTMSRVLNQAHNKNPEISDPIKAAVGIKNLNMLHKIRKDLDQKKRAAGGTGEPWEYINNKHMYFLVNILLNADMGYDQAMEDMKDIHKASLAGKKKIVGAAKEISQYSADNIKQEYDYSFLPKKIKSSAPKTTINTDPHLLTIAANILGINPTEKAKVISRLEEGSDIFGGTDPVEIAENMVAEQREYSGDQFHTNTQNFAQGDYASSSYDIRDLKIAKEMLGMLRQSDKALITELDNAKHVGISEGNDAIEIAEDILRERGEYTGDYREPSVSSLGRVPSSSKIDTDRHLLVQAAKILGKDPSNLKALVKELEFYQHGLGINSKDPIEIAEAYVSEMDEYNY